VRRSNERLAVFSLNLINPVVHLFIAGRNNIMVLAYKLPITNQQTENVASCLLNTLYSGVRYLSEYTS